VKFGVELPTCTAGMAYPVPFASIDDVVRIGLEAEQLGYDEVAGNDHLSTMDYVLNVCLGRTAAEAHDRFCRSQFPRWHASLRGTMQKGVDLDAYEALNLVGTPDEVCKRIAAFEDAGVEALSATMFVGDTVGEMLGQIRTFARTVMPEFA